MKLTTSTKVTIALVLVEIATLLGELFTTSSKVISNTFIGFLAVFLFLILAQWIAFKSLNSKIRTKRLKEVNTDQKSVDLFINRKDDGELTNNEIIAARRIRGFLFIYTLLLPFIFAAALAITFAFV